MLIDDNGQPAGDPANPSLENPDLNGGQGGEGGQNGQPGGQGGTPPATWDEKEKQYKQQVKALNKALIDAKRGQRQQPQPNGQGQDQNVFETPEGQYGITLQLATGKLSQNLEGVYELYPEVPAVEISRIRKNPWAFASHDSYINGDWETAMREVEQAIADRADELAAGGGGGDGTQPNAQQQPKPATISPNQPAAPAVDTVPGSEEDENPWTMPMNKLEQKAKKQLASAQNKS